MCVCVRDVYEGGDSARVFIRNLCALYRIRACIKITGVGEEAESYVVVFSLHHFLDL